MQFKRTVLSLFILSTILMIGHTNAQSINIDLGADVTSSYIWRGMQVNSSPNVQPSISLNLSNFSFGFWGSYSLTNKNSFDDDYATSSEIDTWISYTQELRNGMELTAFVTDYFYPNAGFKFGNFNNYDDPNGPGGHTIEAGLSLTLPESIPLTVSGYYNVYNDAGNNVYFQVDYSTSISDVPVDVFVGATTGSEDNPVYYGADSFSVINLGLTVSKEIEITDEFSLPVNSSLIFNPKAEALFMVFGFSL